MYRNSNSAPSIGSLRRADLAGGGLIVQPNIQNHGLHNLGLVMTNDMMVIPSEKTVLNELSLINRLDSSSLRSPRTPPVPPMGLLTSPRVSVIMGGMNVSPSKTTLEDHSLLGICNVDDFTIECTRESFRFSTETSLETRERVDLENNHDRHRQLTTPFDFNRALQAFQPSHREELRMGPYRGMSMPTRNNPRRYEIMRSNHYHDSQQLSHPPPTLSLQQRITEHVNQQVVANDFHQVPHPLANNSPEILHSLHASYPQPQVPYSPFGAIDEILNARRPGEETFASMMIAEGPLLDRTQNVSLNPHMRTRTKTYRGEGTREPNQDDTIPEFLSCAIWILAIPPKATHCDVLRAIHLQGTGRVFSSSLNGVDEGQPKKTAKIVFTTAEATRLIIDQANSFDGLRICGQKVLVQYDQHRYHEHYNLNQSRAIRVSGPPNLVNFQALLYFWSKNVAFDVLDVQNVSSSPDSNVIDWFFGSILGQSVGAKSSIEKERGLRERGVRVHYRSDPCEW